MKELSIEDKAKRYDEAVKMAQAKIEEAKVFDYDDEQTAHTIRLTTTDIFPELKESEDERIREEIIDHINNMKVTTISDLREKQFESWIALLERQGEQKPIDSTFEIKPKFKVGDTIRELETGNLFYVNSIEDFGYTLHYKDCIAKGCTMSFKYEDNYELVEQNPVVIPKFKVGDFVKDANYHGEPTYEIVGIDSECYICEYRGNKSMGDRSVMHFCFDNPYLRLVEQKTAWSEEDENGLDDALWAIQQARTIAKDENDMGNLWYAERWLKSLRPQNKWKPNDEQIEALDFAADCIVPVEFCFKRRVLKDLLEQLKKL